MDTHPSAILLVEDSAADRTLVERALERAGGRLRGFSLTAVPSAEQAREALRRTRFALILTDYSLPGDSGLDL